MGESADSAFAWPPPRENPHLVGHEPAAGALVEAWGSGRLAHAWLIAGPRGIGKATLAYRFARFVLAGKEGIDGLTMAPEHPVFRRIAAGGHSDLAVIERGLGDRGRLRAEIVVDDVRKANAFLSLTAGEGGWRVVIVDAADEMNRNAANALLKRLEEPPSRVLFLLVSHAPSRMPATLRSRCRLLSLAPLPA
ncbi:MAG: DNA polymerase III subunit delta', partial [Rhodospirillaceae bacterium]|nr:DNA polymerase III subunit delta' [Rhodospirillaceae bacterium]